MKYRIIVSHGFVSLIAEPPALQRQHTQIDPHLQRELQRQILDDKPDFPPPLKPARREEKRNVPTGAASSVCYSHVLFSATAFMADDADA